MKEFLKCTGSLPYGNQYLKFKLLEKYGDSLYIAEGEDLHAIVTFREKTSRMLRDYFNTPNKDGDDAHKRAIIEAAVKFIKHDIKCITTSKNEYPNVSELNLVLTLEFIPPSLHFMLENIIPGKETNRKVASVEQTIVQAVRPRTVTITNWACYSNAPSFPIKVSDRYSLLNGILLLISGGSKIRGKCCFLSCS